VLRTAKGILSGNYLIAAAREALDDPLKRQALGDYLGRYAKVAEWVNADGARWAQVRGEATGVPAALSAGVPGAQQPDPADPDQRRGIASQQAVADAFATAGLIPAKVDVRPLWDDRPEQRPSRWLEILKQHIRVRDMR
jgi:sulfonate transport system substrate-binding protein